MEDNPIFLLAFLSVFHVAGAIALGVAIRGIWKTIQGEGGGIVQSILFVIWGSMFGCMPFGFGLDPTLPIWMLPAQIFIWSTTFLITVFLGRRVLDWTKPLLNVHTGLIVFGGIFMLSGMFGGYAAFNQGEVKTALLMGGVFGVIGAGIFLMGIVGLLKQA